MASQSWSIYGDDTSLDDLTPIAPARPNSAAPIPAIYNGQPATINANGGIIGANGNLLGVLPGSPADVGTGGISPTSNSAPAPSTGVLSSITGALNSGMNVLDSFTGASNADNPNGQKSFFGVSVQDIVFIVLGILLIGAAVFSFKSTQTIIEQGGKLAGKAAEVTAAT